MSSYSPKPGPTGRPGSRSPYDRFSQLATPSSSKSLSRSLTPSNAARPAAPAQNSSDAFSSLLGPAFSVSSNQSNLSLADRRAATQKEREAKAVRDLEAKQIESTVWSGLDILGQGSRNSAATGAGNNNSSANFDGDWLFDKPNPEPSRPTNSSDHAELVDDWGLANFADQIQKPAEIQSRAQEPVSLFDDLNDEDLIPDSFGGGAQPAPVSAGHNEGADDDILGELGKPVTSRPPSVPERTSSAPAREQVERGQADSPPLHIIGQIVEMGFSPEQARLALASTDSGLDVQQALETLLSNGVGAERESESIQDRQRRGLGDFQDDDDGWEERRRNGPRVRPPVQRQPSSSSAMNHDQEQAQTLISADIQERADRLLAQASEIGLNVFNRANALWKDGKVKMQKVYEERATRARPVSDVRPRWMSNVPVAANERMHRGDTAGESSGRGGFRDDEDTREELPPLEVPERERSQDRRASSRPVNTAVSRTANLFDDEPAVYISPARRRPAPSRNAPRAVSSTASTPSPAPQEFQSSPPLRTRQTVSASATVIASSKALKEKGTELYRLGQFASAEQAYSAAIGALPENHLLLVPLYNNRALTWVKIGEHSRATEDCTTVLSIIGADYHPAREAKVTREEEGASIDLADAYLKALRRRAEAYEGREKWELALKDWEAIIACDWSSNMRHDAFTGASRCRNMLSPGKDSSSRPTPSPRPIVRPAAAKDQQDFEAVKKLRQANQAQEQEEQTKASLKDSVDARLMAWKAGKETNVRALVASLDTVLWPELGWQKVGLHELVTPAQMKVRYMKAIAKLHPDKINTGNTTVEQRMIANGVFAALNDAWTAFKQ